MKIVTNKGTWLLHWCIEFQLDIYGVYELGTVVWKFEHTHTPARELKITFLDVSDYSKYSDSNISIFFFMYLSE